MSFSAVCVFFCGIVYACAPSYKRVRVLTRARNRVCVCDYALNECLLMYFYAIDLCVSV